jgi:GxxExxY protein
MLDGNTETTDQILNCAIEVHRALGPGLPEIAYETALCIEMHLRGISFERQRGFSVSYKGQRISEHRPDLIVANQVVVEVKSIERFAPVHRAQMLTYLRVASLKVGLVLNFNSATIKEGTMRVVLNA